MKAKNSIMKKNSCRARTPWSFSNSITFHDVFQELFKTIIVFGDFFLPHSVHQAQTLMSTKTRAVRDIQLL